jgi:ribose transport system permease protein
MSVLNSTLDAEPRTINVPDLLARLRNQGIFLILFLIVVGCVLFVPGFASDVNASNILKRAVPLGLIAIGQTFAIVGGSLDLSVDIAISAIAVFTALALNGKVENILPAVLGALVAGMGIGLVNGLIVTKLKVNAFIATLGTKLILQGILFSNFDNFAGKAPTEFDTLAYGNVTLAYGNGAGIPYGVILMFVVAFLAFVVLRFTKFGHHLYAVGGDREVARLSGVRTDRVLIIAHALTGLCAGIAAIYIVSLLRSGGPHVGDFYDLNSITAVVVGGVPLSGGRGGAWGTIAGVLILAILTNLFNIFNIGAFAQQVLSGAVLILVVALYSFRLRQ